jgi:hypothetical protein
MMTLPMRDIALRVAALLVAVTVSAAAQTTTTYPADTSTIFPNPERGFRSSVEIDSENDFTAYTNTVIHSYVRLDAYKGGGAIGFDDAVLVNLRAGLAAIRRDGKKIILRFAYNHGDYSETAPFHCTNADATEATILAHIGQVASSLEPFKDVILAFEAGFIGCWGEWHSSWYQADDEMPPKTNVVQRLADTFRWPDSSDPANPFEPDIAIRYPDLIRRLQAGTLTPSAKARLAFHNDCFLASADDEGTWGRDPDYTIAQDKALIASLAVDRMAGGETCNESSDRANCATARDEMQAMHYTQLNEDYHPGVIQAFKAGGCFQEFQRNLGYRLRLTTATYPATTNAGAAFNVQFNVTNDGFASPLSRRPVFLVFQGTGGTFTHRLAVDPRAWKSGQSHTVTASVPLGGTMPPGTYRLALWLPDKAAGLRGDPRYSIRLANAGMWNDGAGDNTLAEGIQVGPAAPVNLVATTQSPASIALQWSSPASHFEIERSSNAGPAQTIGTANGTTYTDTTATAGMAYVYRVRAVEPGLPPSPYSNRDTATTFSITNDPLVAGGTTVRAMHVTELRHAVNAVRTAMGLSAAGWSAAVTAGDRVRAAHVQELRDALAAAVDTLTVTDTLLNGGSIKAIHIQELRTALR